MGNYCWRRRARQNSIVTDSPGRNERTSLRHRRDVTHENRLGHYYENDPIFHPTPGVSRPMSQLTEDEQIIIATRLGLLNSLTMFLYDDSNKEKYSECIICMCDYIEGEECRHLPCLHTFHRKCIDEWLLRSFTCPSCLDQVDAVLLSNQSIKLESKDTTDSIRRKRKRRSASNERLSRQHSRMSHKSKHETTTNRSSVPQDMSGAAVIIVTEDANSSSALLPCESSGHLF